MQQKIEELTREIFLHFRSSEDGNRHLSYRQVIMIDADCHQELNIEIKPYRRPISVPNIIRSYLRKNDLTISDFANNIEIGRLILSSAPGIKVKIIEYKILKSIDSPL